MKMLNLPHKILETLDNVLRKRVVINTPFKTSRDYRMNPRAFSLHKACMYNDIDQVEACIAAGQDVNSKSVEGWTPLHWASFWGYTEIAKLLIAAGADVTTKTPFLGWTPLYVSQFCNRVSNNEEMMKLLQQAGATE